MEAGNFNKVSFRDPPMGDPYGDALPLKHLERDHPGLRVEHGARVPPRNHPLQDVLTTNFQDTSKPVIKLGEVVNSKGYKGSL